MYQNSYSRNWFTLTNEKVVSHLCANLKQMRLNQNLSQEDLAEKSGVSRITISRMEQGQAINLLTMVQLLRAMNNLDILNNFNIEPEISPMMVMEAQSKYRKKASPKK